MNAWMHWYRGMFRAEAMLKRRGWKFNCDDSGRWISPYTKIDYMFEEALQIEDIGYQPWLIPD